MIPWRWRERTATVLGLLVVAWFSAAAQAAGPTSATDSPARWLSAEGKSDAWSADTQECRQLLAKLNLGDERDVWSFVHGDSSTELGGDQVGNYIEQVF